MTTEQFWTSTPGEFNLRKRGYYRVQRNILEREARWIAMILNAMPFKKKGAKAVQPDDLIGMSAEKEQQLEAERLAARKKRSRPPDEEE